MLHSEYSGDRLRALRQRALLTQPEVERLTGVQQSTLSALEVGKTRPRTTTLRKLLALYEVRIRTYEARDKEWATQDKARPPKGERGRRVRKERRVLRSEEQAQRERPPQAPVGSPV